MSILITSGAGYISSHTPEPIEAGYTPIMSDNLANSTEESLQYTVDVDPTSSWVTSANRQVEFLYAP